MIRLLAVLLFAVLAGLATPWTARAEDPGWTGTWNTRWREGGARMELRQQGNRVTGTYPAYGGQIEGEVVGREMRGRWVEGSRTGGVNFVLSTDGQSFMGRFDTGEWWTGGRTEAALHGVAVDQAGARQALRSFVLAGNAAQAGDPNEWAKAAAVMDFGPRNASMAPGQKLAAARELFELVDQTTFQLWPIPGRRAEGDQLDLQLHQSGTAAVLPLRLLRGDDRLWRVAMPEGDLGPVRQSLLARSGGRLPPPEDIRRRGTARDAMRSFTAGFSDWTGGGRAQVLAALDLSGYSDATRLYEGELAAAYLNEVLDRVGLAAPQEIPDDPSSRYPYIVFSHPAGAMVLAPGNPAGSPDGPGWRFTPETVRSARDLYTAIEDMPEVEGGTLPDVPTPYFRLRRWVRDIAPSLFVRVGPLEAWQGVGVLAIVVGCFVVGWCIAWFLQIALRLLVGGRRPESEVEFRWPMRLLLTFVLYQFVIPAIGLPEEAKRISVGGTGVVMALAAMWGGWKLIDTFGAGASRRAQASAGTLDEIVVSLILGACKLVLLAGGLVFIADKLSIPYEGVIAGLGIGGLAVAFASKETLSNVFGAGILVADRPFRRGDWIEAGEAKGTVEHVGIRSTRIRTGEDSLMFVPNGKLADTTVNNLGTRRHRVAKAKLQIAHGTDTDRLEAFMNGVGDLVAAVPHVQPGSVQIGVAAITLEGIELQVACCLDVRSAADERADRTALLLGLLRLAEQMQVRLGDTDSATPLAASVAA